MTLMWHNYRTGESDALDSFPTAKEVLDYLPQCSAARCLFEIKIAQGKSVAEAMEAVLSIAISAREHRNPTGFWRRAKACWRRVKGKD